MPADNICFKTKTKKGKVTKIQITHIAEQIIRSNNNYAKRIKITKT